LPVDIRFSHVLPYRDDDVTGALAPAVRLELCSPLDPANAIDITAHLDSGASETIFQGDLAALIGLELLEGVDKRFTTSTGAPVNAKVHRVRVAHSILGGYEMNVAFSMGALSRNLLGLDFFRMFKVCFREYHQELYFDLET
jgi:predicted aspartyl protease